MEVGDTRNFPLFEGWRKLSIGDASKTGVRKCCPVKICEKHIEKHYFIFIYIVMYYMFVYKTLGFHFPNYQVV